MLTLVRRSSAWSVRVSAAQPKYRQATSSEPRQVMMVWLHHRSYGTLGVYVSEALYEQHILPVARQWLQVRSSFRPLRVHAQPDDPRSVRTPELAPLAIMATEIVVITITNRTDWAAPCLPQAQHIRVIPGRRCGHGILAPVAQQPDVSYWQVPGALPAIVHWNRIAGVVSTLGATRYLRYVLSCREEHQERRH